MIKKICLCLLSCISCYGSTLPPEYTIAVSSMGHYIIRVNDQHIGWVLSQGRHWEEELVRECLGYIRPGSNVIDIGANIGTCSVPFSKKAERVYAFEPQRLVFQQFTANCLLNGAKNIYPYQVALGSKCSTAFLSKTVNAVPGFSPERELTYDLTDYPINFGGVSLGDDGDLIEMRTLDSYQLENVSLIKVDVEGAEPLVFYGAKETILRNRPVIIYEKREDMGVTPAMIRSLDLTSDEFTFDIEQFVREEMPGVYEAPRMLTLSNYALIPYPLTSGEIK